MQWTTYQDPRNKIFLELRSLTGWPKINTPDWYPVHCLRIKTTPELRPLWTRR